MTDEELIARLTSVPADGWGIEDLCQAAADRIEVLVKDKERLGREVNMARYGQPDFAWSIHKQATADLRARAERLEAALRSLLKYVPTDVVECRGDKCREPWCASCFGWEAAEKGAEKARSDGAYARAALTQKDRTHD